MSVAWISLTTVCICQGAWACLANMTDSNWSMLRSYHTRLTGVCVHSTAQILFHVSYVCINEIWHSALVWECQRKVRAHPSQKRSSSQISKHLQLGTLFQSIKFLYSRAKGNKSWLVDFFGEVWIIGSARVFNLPLPVRSLKLVIIGCVAAENRMKKKQDMLLGEMLSQWRNYFNKFVIIIMWIRQK